MKIKILSFMLSLLVVAACSSRVKEAPAEEAPTMKEFFKNDFLIGTAIPMKQVNDSCPQADSVVVRHFNSIVAENCMKCEKIHPAEDTYFWDDADAFVKYGEERGMAIIGHTLVWHSQLAPWFPYDKNGKPVTAEVMKQRMHDHIMAVAGRYKGRIYGWDVVNEAIEDDGSYRHTPFYDALGEEYIPLAFEYAREADPDAELYLNDYSMAGAAKRDAYVALVRKLKERGLRIDGVGMQSHIGLDYPDLAEYEKTIVALGAEGVKVMITEFDMSALPTLRMGADIGDSVAFNKLLDPYPDGLPKKIDDQWNARMDSLFRIYMKHSDLISRFSVWGIDDGTSWKNGFPMKGRTDYPLLFDRNYNLKPFMEAILSGKAE